VEGERTAKEKVFGWSPWEHVRSVAPAGMCSPALLSTWGRGCNALAEGPAGGPGIAGSWDPHGSSLHHRMEGLHIPLSEQENVNAYIFCNSVFTQCPSEPTCLPLQQILARRCPQLRFFLSFLCCHCSSFPTCLLTL
jgi:hypothetical protein